ncbi:NAD(P)-dependent oxidoreductase [Actinokineospora sp. NBRC 105648]|uniref:NAD(P)-dependent oxidoreductase n=1 Tax=Actinokineospora sp. NBRC 105648 TaxID=3032206 RepID=UPI0024A5A1E7|nr:NAD(P)-dependent oxidoreductase [Actinokineospora sp. NBRC 105648]GLZ42036.1 3-hydroxyisobutyrate dehydrogenase [Actinokineospora sp. NBRC 105648]
MTGGPPGRPGSAPGPAPDLSAWTVGVVGLGTMGGGMAARLADTGARLRLHNRTAGRAAGLAGRPRVTEVATPAEAALGAHLVLVSVADDDALAEVVTGPEGVSAADPPLVVNATTVSPEVVRALGERVPLLDAGVLGNGEHARSGQLRWYVGGDAALLDRARPVLDALGRQVLHLGPAGTGMALKIALNLLMGIEMQALAEVAALAEGAGLDRTTTLDAVAESGFAAPVMRYKAARMARRSYDRPDFRLRLMAKDLALAAAQMDAAGLVLPVTRAAADTHASAAGTDLADQDCAAIAEVFGDPVEAGR